VVLIHSPTELGSQAILFAEGITPDQLERSLTHVTRASYGPDQCVTGYLNHRWPPVDTSFA
jgi:hypothetical protein